MRWWIGLLGLALVAVVGCRSPATHMKEYQTVAEDMSRDTKTAIKENAEAYEAMERGDLEKAEKRLKVALTADGFFGPAHNNLGICYLRQKKYYQAAWEFQYAGKLMPYSAEPRNNLGMVYEEVCRMDEAEKWYDEALSLQPDNPQLIGNLVRTRLRENKRDERTCQLLSDLILKDTRPEWVAWARERLVMIRPEAKPPEIVAPKKGEEKPPAPSTAPAVPQEQQ
jgi:Flp pilus assembly protein TadD